MNPGLVCFIDMVSRVVIHTRYVCFFLFHLFQVKVNSNKYFIKNKSQNHCPSANV